MYRYCIFMILALGIVACGDSPMSPEEAIVGTWGFQETNLVAVFAKGLEEYLVSQGMDRETAKGFASEVTNDSEFEITMSGWIRINGDNTWEDDTEGSGTWRIDGEEFVLTQGSTLSLRLQYSLDGDSLTLIYPEEFVADLFKLVITTTSTEEERVLNSLVANVENIRIVYRRIVPQ